MTTQTAIAKVKPVKPTKLKGGNDELIAEQLTALFHDAQNGARRIVALGIFAHYVKEKLAPKGRFGPWVETHCPDVSYRAVRWHMQISETALEAIGFKTLGSFFSKIAHIQNGNALPISHPGEVFLLPDKSVPEEAKPIREKMFSMIDGKSGRQLISEWKQSEEDENGNIKGKKGRRKGEGGASAAQRARAKEAEKAAEIEERELWATELIERLNEECDDKHLGEIDNKLAEKLLEALQLGADYLKGLARRRQGKEAGQ